MRRLTGASPDRALLRMMELILRDDAEALAAMAAWNRLARTSGRADERMSQPRAERVVQDLHRGAGPAPLLLAIAAEHGNVEGLATVSPQSSSKRAAASAKLAATTAPPATGGRKQRDAQQIDSPARHVADYRASDSLTAAVAPVDTSDDRPTRTKRKRPLPDAVAPTAPPECALADSVADMPPSGSSTPAGEGLGLSLRQQLSRAPLPAATSIAQALRDGDINAQNDTVCHRCKSNIDESDVLICETCDLEFHRKCLPIPLALVPQGEWQCQPCLAQRLFADATAIGACFAGGAAPTSEAPSSKRGAMALPSGVAATALGRLLTARAEADAALRRHGDRKPLLLV